MPTTNTPTHPIKEVEIMLGALSQYRMCDSARDLVNDAEANVCQWLNDHGYDNSTGKIRSGSKGKILNRRHEILTYVEQNHRWPADIDPAEIEDLLHKMVEPDDDGFTLNSMGELELEDLEAEYGRFQKVILTIQGGCLTGVLSTNLHLSVELLDLDNDDRPLMTNRLAELEADNTYYQINPS